VFYVLLKFYAKQQNNTTEFVDFQLIFSIAAIQYSEHFASVQAPGNVGLWPSNLLPPPPTKINFHSDRLLTLPFFYIDPIFPYRNRKSAAPPKWNDAFSE